MTMIVRRASGIFAAAAQLPVLVVPLAAQQRMVIRAGTLIDGMGGASRSATVVVENGRIAGVDAAAGAPVSYDLSRLTVLPGLIDTHVHIDTHLGRDGRATAQGETPQQSMLYAALYAAENAYNVLLNGFTTVQSIGSPLDLFDRADQLNGHARSSPEIRRGGTAATRPTRNGPIPWVLGCS